MIPKFSSRVKFDWGLEIYLIRPYFPVSPFVEKNDMPIYEYQCTDCGHKVEKLQKISDDPLKDCPDCGTASLKKLVSAAAFRLKGSGWYETDFKDEKSQKNLSQADDKPGKKKEDQTDTKKTGEPSTTATSETNASSDTKKDQKSEKPTSKTSPD